MHFAALELVGFRNIESLATAYDANAVIKGVRDEVFPYDKNIFRTEKGILESLSKLDALWEQVSGRPEQGTAQQLVRSREAAALVAAARWSYFAGLQRTETRGMHKRLDYPALDPAQRRICGSGGSTSCGRARMKCRRPSSRSLNRWRHCSR